MQARRKGNLHEFGQRLRQRTIPFWEHISLISIGFTSNSAWASAANVKMASLTAASAVVLSSSVSFTHVVSSTVAKCRYDNLLPSCLALSIGHIFVRSTFKQEFVRHDIVDRDWKPDLGAAQVIHERSFIRSIAERAVSSCAMRRWKGGGEN